MNISFYGKLGEQIGREVEISLPTGAATVAQLRAHLAGLYPRSADELTERSSVGIGDRIVPDDHLVSERDRVEFFPPLSGG